MAERPYACLRAGRKDGRPHRLTPDEALARVGDRPILHARVEPVFAASIGDDGFILRGRDLAELRAAAADIQALAAGGGARPG